MAARFTQKNYSSSMYIGKTTGGLKRPVFWDAHTTIFNNAPGGVIVTGSPGSGKTFFCLTCASLSAITGKTTIILDLKGDFVVLKNLEDQIGKVTFWNLGVSGAKSRAGLLDPFYMADEPGEILNLVIDVLEIFTGGLTNDELSALTPILKDVAALPVPSLNKLMEYLQISQDKEAQNLGTKLDLISQLPISRLCFAPGNAKRAAIPLDRGTTVITFPGIDLPGSPEEAREGSSNRLISGVLYLITDYIRRVMHKSDPTIPKLIIADEAWALVSSDQGAKIMKSVALLGRSKSVALMLATQNVSHLKKLDIENTISTRFAFGTSLEEAKQIVTDMRLPEGQDFEEVLESLRVGECLMSDFRNRYAKVQITDWNARWNKDFETNPLEKARELKKKALAEAQRKQQTV